MAVLTKIDTVPLQYEAFSFEFEQWLSLLVDTMNESLRTIEESLETLDDVNFIGTQVTSTPFSASINNSYLIANAALTTVALPAVAAVGAVVRIIGLGAGGWILKPSTGQTIKVSASSAGTSIASTNRYDCISVICVVENTTWVTTSSQTAGFTIT